MYSQHENLRRQVPAACAGSWDAVEIFPWFHHVWNELAFLLGMKQSVNQVPLPNSPGMLFCTSVSKAQWVSLHHLLPRVTVCFLLLW